MVFVQSNLRIKITFPNLLHGSDSLCQIKYSRPRTVALGCVPLPHPPWENFGRPKEVKSFLEIKGPKSLLGSHFKFCFCQYAGTLCTCRSNGHFPEQTHDFWHPRRPRGSHWGKRDFLGESSIKSGEFKCFWNWFGKSICPGTFRFLQ